MKNFSDKAENLYKLKIKNIESFEIPNFIYFNLEDWKFKKKFIIKKIIRTLDKNICIRSSFYKEDDLNSSLAGKFESYIKIENNNKNIIYYVNKLILQYQNFENKKKASLKNNIIIQNFIDNSICSGVVTNYVIGDGSPYYTINYNNFSSSTSSVTSGDKHSFRVLYVYRDSVNRVRSLIFKRILESIKKIEKIYKKESLDIEFAVTKNSKIHILQIRPISTNSKWEKIDQNKFKDLLKKNENKFDKILKRNSNYGKKVVFGLMPDWNPAEIIGFQPNMFSYSLYKHLVTDEMWSRSREEMGYKKILKPILMYSFTGKPYIDLRLSFNSLIPKYLKGNLAKKITSYWIEKLIREPFNHDKIEFEVTENCFYFGQKDKINKEYKFLTKKEKSLFYDSLKNLTCKIIKNYKLDFNKMNKEIIQLESFRVKTIKEYLSIKKNEIEISNILLNKCRKLGIKAFAKQARNAFIAKKILLSLVKEKILNKKTYYKMLNNLNTISHEYITDKKKIEKNLIKNSSFIKKYFHLRPNSYNILNKRYSSKISPNNMNILEINNLLNYELDNKILSTKELNTLCRALKKNKIDINGKELISFCIGAIKLRENYKFFFTRTLSDGIELLKKFETKSKSKINFSNVDIKDILSKRKIKKLEKQDYQKFVKLPYLIVSQNDFYVSSILLSKPNFITYKNINGEMIFLNKGKINHNIKNKIVVIENADPGFDWIFSKKIKGLITKYGGINSHMSIRCEELNIPAIIGFGEDNFSKIENKTKISFDCKYQKINIGEI